MRAVSHGSDIDGSGGSCGKHTSPARLASSQPDVGTQHANVGYPGVDFSMASKPVFLSSGLAVSNEHAVEVVDPDFHAESSAVVQGKSCVERAVSHGFDVALSGGTCGKDTSPAHHARSTWCGHAVLNEIAYFKEPGNSHRREISWCHTRQPPSRLAAWARERVFLHTVWCRQTLVEL